MKSQVYHWRSIQRGRLFDLLRNFVSVCAIVATQSELSGAGIKKRWPSVGKAIRLLSVENFYVRERIVIQFQLNGEAVSSDSPPDTPLLWVIRDELKLKGTKFGCGIAMCGACTVHLDGAATRSCVTPVSAVENKAVTTIEGLDSKEGQALQAAWVDEQVPQCGYCQSGQIMQASNLLANNPNPSDAEINEAMNGNLCRCMSYNRIRSAIKTAASGGEA